MGQDNSCGICGKHYQSCKHKSKVHVKLPSNPHSYCGMTKHAYKNVILITMNDYAYRDIDKEDICKTCYRMANLQRFDDVK